MNLLPYFIYWLISRDLDNSLNLCKNDVSGENGICLSEWECLGIAKGFKVGGCDSGVTDGFCCKIAFNFRNETLDVSSLILRNGRRGKFGGSWKHLVEWAEKYEWKNGRIYPPYFSDILKRIILQISDTKTGEIKAHQNHVNTAAVSDVSQKLNGSENLQRTSKFRNHHLLTFFVPNRIRRHQIPVFTHSMHPLWKQVQLYMQNDLHKSVQLDPTHNFHKPVELDPTHDLRKPVELDPTHDLRESVELDPTYDLRKPVKLMESHDLRWPVMEESDHDLRNHIPEIDIFRSENLEDKLKKIMLEFLRNTTKVDGEDDEIYQILYEDEFLKANCVHNHLVHNHSVTSNDTIDVHAMSRMTAEYKHLFSDSLEVCGISFEKSTGESKTLRKSGKWPWMVSLQEYILNSFVHKCGGSLINHFWVITAAHCVEFRPKWDFLIQLGTEDVDASQHFIERHVHRISIHPKFNNYNFDHDIALLRMESPVTFQPDLVPICLPWRTEEMENQTAVVLSWKLPAERGGTKNTWYKRTVPVLTNKECDVMFSKTGSTEKIQQNFFCASSQDVLYESCTGNSGRPLVVKDIDGRWSLTGLYSWGKTCRVPNQPEVYIRISRYAKWIEDTIACYEYNINLHGMD